MEQIHPDAITVSVKVASDISGLSPWQLKQRCEAGLIASRFDGPQRLIELQSLRNYLDNLPTVRVRPAS